MLNFQEIPKSKAWDYFILGARILLAWTFLSYGYSKLTDGQFGLTEAELLSPISELSPFRISWYLFDFQPFKAFIGVSQLICGTLLVWNRTAVLGAFLFLPIVATILIIDMTFMPEALAIAFTWRLSYYILLDFLILAHYKDRMIVIWNATVKGINTKFNYPIWVYLTLPVVVIGMEILPFFLRSPIETVVYVVDFLF